MNIYKMSDDNCPKIVNVSNNDDRTKIQSLNQILIRQKKN